MKNRKIHAYLIALTIVFSPLTVRAAEEVALSSDTQLVAAQNLHALGLLSGTTPDELSKPLTRLVGITMILKALGYDNEDAAVVASKCPFLDLNQSNVWGRGWASLALEQGISSGQSATRFGPEALMSLRELCAFELRALGYAKDVAWQQSLELAKKEGLISEALYSSPSTSFSKGHAADIIYKALKQPVQGGSFRLIEKLISLGRVDVSVAFAQGLVKETNYDFTSMKALNASLIEVTCLQHNIATKLEEFTIKDRNGAIIPIAKIEQPTWDLIGRTFLIHTAAPLINNAVYTLASSGSTGTFQGSKVDAVGPRLLGIVSEKADEVILTFDEPVVLSALQLSLQSKIGSQPAPEIVQWNYLNNLSTVKVTTKGQINGMTYVLASISIQDYASNALQNPLNQSYLHLERTYNKQTLVSAQMDTAKTLVLTFGEAVDLGTGLDRQNYHVNERYGNLTEIQITSIAIYKDSKGYVNDHGVKLTLAAIPQAGTLYEVRVENVLTNKSMALDEKKISTAFTGMYASEAPVVTAIAASATYNTEITLTLSGKNELLDASIRAELIQIRETYGSKNPLPFTIKKIEGRVITLTTQSQAEATLYSVSLLPGIEDLAGKISTESFETMFASKGIIVK